VLLRSKATPFHITQMCRAVGWMLVETAHVTEFEYYFACTRKGVHLYYVKSPGKMIFAVLEL